jgi:serine protease
LSALTLKHRWILCLAALLGALLFGGAALAGGVQLPAPVDDDDQTDQLIIKYRAGSAARDRPDVQTMADAHDRLRRAGVQMRRLRGNAFGANVMKLDRRFKSKDLAALARAIAAQPDVEYAEPDRRMHILATPNDSYYPLQWHYFEAAGGINAPAAWNLSTGSGVVVAVIDTGYRPHVDLAANIVPGYDMIIDTAVSNDGDGRDSDALDPGDWTTAGLCSSTSVATSSSWHGTHVAGTIAAVTNNASGVAGVAYGAKVQPVRALGRCGGYTSDIADGIVWASGLTVAGLPLNPTPARVISLSLGGSGACDATTQAAIDGARSRGTVIVVAAGNSNVDVSNSSPANCAGVIAVAAVDRSGGKAYYSNYGSGITLAAPGGGGGTNGVVSTWNVGTTTPGADAYAYASGTSMATPHVSAVAALMFSANPDLKPGQVERLLKSSARAFPATCSPCGAGIVNAGAAVSSAIAAWHPSLVSSANPSMAGGVVTFTVTVTGDSPGGTVQFMDGSNALGSPVDLSAATPSTSTASLNVSSLAAGSHSITAAYSGDANNAGVTSTALTQAVAQAASSTALNASAASLTQGQTLTLTATVSGYAPTGSVQFKDAGIDLGGTVTLVDGLASYATNTLIVGNHTITAVYSGDANNAGSTSAVASVSVAAVAGPSGGVGGGAANADIPTLPQWGLILLGCVLLGVAHRQRPRTARRA